MSDLIESFCSLNEASIDCDGIRIPNALARMRDGGVTVMAMAFDGEQPLILVYRTVAKLVAEHRPTELVFGWDRYAKPGQEIPTRDWLSVHHWREGVGWRYGVMPYEAGEPGKAHAIVWDHPIFVPMLRRETMENLRRLLMPGWKGADHP